jgi:acetoin utilization deacetylase AcuC-like enzyme
MKVLYTPRMVADSRSMSPSAAKPAAVVAEWLRHELAIEVIEPQPVTIDDLARVHSRDYVEAVLAGREPNGFGNSEADVAATLVYTSGSMLSAARLAIAHRTITCAPCSGFHHAAERASEYCTFNGLVVAACALRAEGLVRRVGILDCDMHYGDGTDLLIDKLDARAWITHYTAGADYESPAQANGFLARLPSIVETMRDCDVVLYQAGADPHIDDPLGGWLTTAELRRRDEIVFETCSALGLPVAWNFAGGYQVEPDGSIPKVLAIHENTARAALAILTTARACSP